MARAPAWAGSRLATHARRTLGLALLLFGVVPLYRLLDAPATGLAGAATVAQSDASLAYMLWGTVILLAVGILAGLVLRADRVDGWCAAAGAFLCRPRVGRLALALALCSAALTALFNRLVLAGAPNLIDGMAQLVHARYLAAGRLAGPVSDAAFHLFPNMLLAPGGWVSQYPPGHLMLLAAALRLGAPWAAGALAVGVTVFFMVLVLERLLPAERALARLAGVLLAVNPFLICLAGAYMSHATVAALASLAAYASLRAAGRGRAGIAWAVLAGAAAGAMVATRPLTGVALGLTTTLGILVWAGEVDGRGLVLRAGALAAGALPPLAGLAAYNARLFGSPFRFGYTAALGPSTGLGLHLDPWGNAYGAVQALAYTSSDLVSLGLYLLETPLSAVAVVGLYLALAPRLTRGAAVLLAWTLLPVAANLLYWHHGLFMGPRMLAEVAPAWVALAVLAGAGLARTAPRALPATSFSPRAGAAAVLLLALAAGVLWSGPRRALSYRGPLAIRPPEVGAPALVFVHGGWTGRLAAVLSAAGMRADSVETALRQNTTCEVQAAVSGEPARLDLRPRASGLPPQLELSPGDRIRVRKGEPLSAECLRQAAADRFGVVDVAPHLWLGDLPGLAPRGALFVRDLGPEWNARLIRRLPGRLPLLYAVLAPDTLPRFHGYSDGMRRIWVTTAATDERAAKP